MRELDLRRFLCTPRLLILTSIANSGTVSADNFDPAYLDINPNGTVPSLTAPSLAAPLVDSRDVLRHLDAGRPAAPSLAPAADDKAAHERMGAIIELAHAPALSTNLILLQARDAGELRAKREGLWGSFVAARQSRLEAEREKNPAHGFYGPKAAENGQLASLYAGDAVGADHERFFAETHDAYVEFARELGKLDALLVLPFALGDTVTEADLHVVPWLAHAMWGAGTEPTSVLDFAPLEELVRKSVPGFTVGPRIKEWWGNFSERASFKKVFPVLH